MRQPQQRPAAPRRSILKRGDGARRARQVLAQSLEHARRAPRGGGEGHPEADVPDIRAFIRQQRRQKQATGPGAEAETRVTWQDLKLSGVHTSAGSACGSEPSRAAAESPHLHHELDQQQHCEHVALDRGPSMRDLVDSPSTSWHQCGDNSPPHTATERSLRGARSSAADAPWPARHVGRSSPDNSSSESPADSQSSELCTPGAEATNDAATGREQSSPVYSRPASLPRHRALPQALDISPAASPTPRCGTPDARGGGSPPLQPPPMSYGLSFASLVASTADWPPLLQSACESASDQVAASRTPAAQPRQSRSASPRRCSNRESRSAQPAGLHQPRCQHGQAGCPADRSSEPSDAKQSCHLRAALQQTAKDEGLGYGGKARRCGGGRDEQPLFAASCASAQTSRLHEAGSDRPWDREARLEGAATSACDLGARLATQSSSRDVSWQITAYAPGRSEGECGAGPAHERAADEPQLSPFASCHDPLAALLASGTSHLQSVSSAAAGCVPWPEAHKAMPRAWSPPPGEPQQPSTSVAASQQYDGCDWVERSSAQQRHIAPVSPLVPQEYLAAAASAHSSSPLSPATGHTDAQSPARRAAWRRVSPDRVDTGNAANCRAPAAPVQTESASTPRSALDVTPDPLSRRSSNGPAYTAAPQLEVTSSAAPGPPCGTARPESASQRVQDMFADVWLLEQLRQRMRAELSELRGSSGHQCDGSDRSAVDVDVMAQGVAHCAATADAVATDDTQGSDGHGAGPAPERGAREPQAPQRLPVAAAQRARAAAVQVQARASQEGAMPQPCAAEQLQVRPLVAPLGSKHCLFLHAAFLLPSRADVPGAHKHEWRRS